MKSRGPAYAGILAALAIVLTGRAAHADEPTPADAPALQAAPAPAPTAIPWLAQPSPAAKFTAPESRSSSSRMLWLVLPALALGGAAVYMRLAKRRGSHATTSRRLDVLDTARVGPKAHVVVVSVGGRQLLLGVTEQSVQRLAWLPAEKKVEALPVEVTAEPISEKKLLPEGPFAHILKSFTQSKTPAGTPGSDAALKIAAETKDLVERRTVLLDGEAQEARALAKTATLVAPDASELEGQVSGLKKRRAGRSAGRAEGRTE